MTLRFARLLAAAFAFAALPALAQNLATVNGKPVPAARAEALAQQLIAQGQKDTPELRDMIKKEMIVREILVQEAQKKGLANRGEVKTQIEMTRQSILINALRVDFLRKNPVTEGEIKAEYDRLAKVHAGDKEYHARHILVEKEGDAQAIIAKLKEGANFDELAKQSKDPGSASKGGDLGWTVPAAFVKSFADAMVALQKGKITETPVQTQFGYHVIKLEDVRDAKTPTLDDVKPQIQKSLQDKKLQEFQEGIVKRAKVK
ncbi:MAG: peptidylprolyl isomerase [Burkholderiaceae bacterium]|nr:peptidylprolyl isomerase [Burkholderiaceae bacterium]